MTRTEYETKTRNLRKEVHRLYKAGYSRQEIADATGYSKSYVERIIYAINGPAEKKTLSDSDREQILKLRTEGKTIREIAKEVGFSTSTVQKCLKDQREAEKEKSNNKTPDPKMPGNVLHIPIPSGTELYETVREDGTTRKIKWTLVRQYPYHAMFKNQYGKRRCFTNAELMNRGFYK